MTDFIPGLELAGRFYDEAVRPILDRDFPGIAHSAALIGPGSEVLGFDTPMSRDHHWAPRVAQLPVSGLRVSAVGGVGAHRSGRTDDGAHRRYGRRDWLAYRCHAADPRCDAAVLPDGAPIRAVYQVVRHGVRAAAMRCD